MELRFWIDPETELPHIYGHGVTEEEVKQVLAQPQFKQRSGDNSFSIFGQTSAGRYLKVVFVPDTVGDSGFVVTAFPIRGKGLNAYRRRRREKDDEKTKAAKRLDPGKIAKASRETRKHDGR